MPDTKISLLTDGVTANGPDAHPVARAGANVFVTNAYIAEYIRTLVQTLTNKTLTTPVLGVATATSLVASSYVKVSGVPIASLPAAGTVGAGAGAFVTDALAPTFGATVAAGGAVNVPVYSDGAAWKVG